MKTKPDSAAVAEAVHLTALKVAKTRRIVDAEEKLAQEAKVRFKSAKKTWKLARKTARRSAKKLKQAEKQLAMLEKQLKHSKARTGAKGVRKAAKATNPASRNRRRPTIASPTSVTPASAPASPQNNETAPG